MFKRLTAAALVVAPQVAMAASTFVPLQAIDVGSFSTCNGFDWCPVFSNELHPIVDLRGVKKFRLVAQRDVKGVASHNIELSVQISTDGGSTFSCLGPGECVAVPLRQPTPSLPEPPRAITALPVSQRGGAAVLRYVVRSTDGTVTQGSTTVVLSQFY